MKAITGRQIGTVGAGRHRVAGTPGLFVLVHASGARSWVYRGWNGTKEIMRGLGCVIDVSLIDARNAAIRLRAGIIDGAELPLRRSRIAQRAAAHTWQDAFDRLTARKAGTVRESTVRAADSVWRKHMQPTLGAADVAATSREDVINLIANIGGSSARKVRNLAREIGSLAVSLGWTATNPAGAEIDVALPTAAKRTGTGHYRAMPHAMIGEWLRSLPAGPVANAIRVLVLTGARLSDVLGAEWAEIDGKVLTVAGRATQDGSGLPDPAHGSAYLRRSTHSAGRMRGTCFRHCAPPGARCLTRRSARRCPASTTCMGSAHRSVRGRLRLGRIAT